MKHLKSIFYVGKFCFFVLFLLTFLSAKAQVTEADMDSVEISLLTCSPHDEIYSLYGHTAIRYHDLRDARQDLSFNYGVFNFKTPYFILRFTFGQTDYELGVVPFEIFKEEYRRFGSSVTEQVLNLTNTEKLAIRNALAMNLMPENKTYRYNFFYNNCTSKARDAIEQGINGRIQYTEKQGLDVSYRDIIHQCTNQHPWAAFGNDLLLGVAADFKTTLRQQEFLPANLMYDFDHAQIIFNGRYRPLVSERRIAVKPGVQLIKSEFPLSPSECGVILLLFSLLLLSIEQKKNNVFWWYDILLMLLIGLSGIIISAMFFSQHPTTSTNLQVFLLNPLPLFFIPSVVRKHKTNYWKLSLLLVILFFFGGIWQEYAEGMYFLALSLLTRCWRNLRIQH